MNLYEFVLEVEEFVSAYEHREFVLAPDDRTATLFAQEFALHWRPNALYDTELEVYSTPDGVTLWMLARCAPITHLTVPVAGREEKLRVALVPELEVKT